MTGHADIDVTDDRLQLDCDCCDWTDVAPIQPNAPFWSDVSGSDQAKREGCRNQIHGDHLNEEAGIAAGFEYFAKVHDELLT